MRVYISGKITGLPIDEAEALFQIMEDKLTSCKHEPVNPCKIVPYSPEITYKTYILADIDALFDCDAIIMLDNWQTSKGARIEHSIAVELGKQVYYPSTQHLILH